MLWYPDRISGYQVKIGTIVQLSHNLCYSIRSAYSICFDIRTGYRALISGPNIWISSHKLIVRIFKSSSRLKRQFDNRICPDISTWLYNHLKTGQFVRFTNVSIAQTILFIVCICKIFFTLLNIKRIRLVGSFKNKDKLSGFWMVKNKMADN
jgi:hypothetical protein